MKTKKQKPLRLHPIERQILRRNWSQHSIDASIHALAGENTAAMMDKAGGLFWVVLHATREESSPLKHSPERRIIRGAVNTLGEMSSDPTITDSRRASVWAGLQAVQRIAPQIEAEKLFVSAAVLQSIVRCRAVGIGDFTE